MKKNRFWLIAAGVLLSFYSLTQDGNQTQGTYPCIYVETTDGNVFEASFVDSEILFQGDRIEVITPQGKYQFDFDRVNNISFSLRSETKNDALPVQSPVEVYLDRAGRLNIRGDRPLNDVAVYSLTGIMLKKVATRETGIVIDISDFDRGVYIVKTYGGTVKIIK